MKLDEEEKSRYYWKNIQNFTPDRGIICFLVELNIVLECKVMSKYLQDTSMCKYILIITMCPRHLAFLN